MIKIEFVPCKLQFSQNRLQYSCDVFVSSGGISKHKIFDSYHSLVSKVLVRISKNIVSVPYITHTHPLFKIFHVVLCCVSLAKCQNFPHWNTLKNSTKLKHIFNLKSHHLIVCYAYKKIKNFHRLHHHIISTKIFSTNKLSNFRLSAKQIPLSSLFRLLQVPQINYQSLKSVTFK